MRGNIRLAVRCVALAAATLGFYGMRLALLAFTFAFHKTDRRLTRSLFKHWAGTCARIVGMRIEVEGPPPEPPFFLVTNHVSYLDGLTLGSQLGCLFIAKSEVASWPVLGFLARQANVIFIDRKKRSDTLRVNDHIEQALADGEGVIMFAESTTSRGTEVCPFKTALFEAVARSNFPVHCAAIHYDAPPGSPPASEWITWWTPISFGAHALRVLRQPGLNAKLSFGETPISGTDRKLLAEQTRAAVQALFQPVD